MPILPDVRQMYNTNLSNRPDTSGAEGQGMIYDAIGKVSNQLQDVTTKIAADMHEKESSLEASSIASQYEADYAKRREAFENDPNLLVYKNPKAVEDAWIEQQRTVKRQMIDGASSWKAQQKVQGLLADSEGKEALQFLAWKDDKLRKESGMVADEMASALSQLTSDVKTTTIDSADKQWKNSVSKYFTTFQNQIPITEIDKYNIHAADVAAINSIESELYNGNVVSAASAIIGKDAATQLMKLSKKNFANGTPLETDPEIQKILNYKAEKEYLKKVSPAVQQQLMGKILHAISKKPREDISIWKRELNNVGGAAMSGSYTYKEALDNIRVLDASMPDDAQEVDAFDLVASAANAQFMENAKKANAEWNLTSRPEFAEYMKDNYALALDGVMRSGSVNNALAKIGGGDVNRGMMIAHSPRLAKGDVDKLYNQYMENYEKDLKEYEADPIKAATKNSPLDAVEQRALNGIFGLGKFLRLDEMAQSDVMRIDKILSDRRDKSRYLMGGMSPVNEILTDKEKTDIVKLWEQSSQDQGQVLRFVNSLRLMSPEVSSAIVQQIGKPELLIAPYLKNPIIIQQMAIASKDLKANAKMAKMDDPESYKLLRKSIIDNTSVTDFSNAIIRGDRTKGKAVSESFVDSVAALTLQYMANGVDQDDAIKSASRDIIENNFDLMDLNNAFLASNKSVVVVPKGSGIDPERLHDTVGEAFRSEDTWKNMQGLYIPPKIQNASNLSGGKAHSNFASLISKTATLVPSIDGNTFEVVYQDTIDGRGNWQTVFVTGEDGKPTPMRYTVGQLKTISNRNSPSVSITSPATWIQGVDKPKVVKELINSTVKQSARDYIVSPSSVDFSRTKGFEGANNTNFNKVVTNYRKDKKTIISQTLYGGLTLAALQDVDKIVLNKTPLKSINDYAKAFKTQGMADTYFKGYMSVVRRGIDKRINLSEFDPIARNILTDAGFVFGVEGLFDSKLPQYLKDGNIDAAKTVIADAQKGYKWNENYRNNQSRLQWMLQNLQMLK